MSTLSRRFEILLPMRFNDGQPVPDELIADTLLTGPSQALDRRHILLARVRRR
jgi:hypothetical protein